jgi:MATE family multidrug resistance protein
MEPSGWRQRWQDAGGGRELLRLAWPLILSNSFWTIQIVLDRVLLSRASGASVGAAMSGALLFWTPIALLQYTVNYATTFVAQYTGAGRSHRVGPAVWQALYIAVIAGLAIMALSPLAEILVALGQHTPHTQEMEAVYFRCLCFAALPILVTAAANSFFAGRGDSRTVLCIDAAGLVVNAFLAYAWIFGRFGFPALGIEGAGWATVLGTSTSAVLGLALMLRKRHRVAYCTASGWRFDGPLFRRLLRFGFPNGLMVGLDTFAFTVFFFLLGRQGDAEQSASSIAFTLNLITFLPPVGMGQSVAILVGQRLGENCPELAARTTWTALWITLVYMAIMAIPYIFLPHAMAHIFQSQDDALHWEHVAGMVPVLLRFVALYSLFDAINLMFSFALRGAGDTRFVAVASFSLAWPVMVAPTWAAWYYQWGLYVAWTFAAVYIGLLALVYWRRFRQGRWRSMRVIETVPGVTLETEPEIAEPLARL